MARGFLILRVVAAFSDDFLKKVAPYAYVDAIKPSLHYSDYFDFKKIFDENFKFTRRLAYGFDDEYYMDAATGELVKPYEQDEEAEPVYNALQESKATATNGDADNLTPGEIVEPEAISDLRNPLATESLHR